MSKKNQPPIEIFEGSGNVFADLGLPNADELLVKAELVRQISILIEERNLTQAEAARILGTNQPTVSDLVRGYLGKFSIERLLVFLNRLDRDVDIVVRPKPPESDRGHLRVASGFRVP